jgi:outer membrane protein TolC
MHKLLTFLVIIPVVAFGQLQDTITIFECYDLAMNVDPAFREKILLETQNHLKVKNANVNWYPSLDLNGSYTWQSEVVELGVVFPVPGLELPRMPHYNYKMTLDVHQTIYDGGIARSQKEIENSSYAVSRQQVEVELNALKEKVNTIFFYLLLMQKQEQMTGHMLEELNRKIMIVESGVKNGVLLSTDLDQIKAEYLKVEQLLNEIRISEQSAREILGILIGEEIGGKTFLMIPDVELDPSMEPERPEYQLFDLQTSNLASNIKMVNTQRHPKLFVFGTLGYGNPALNFFKDEFREYYIVGAGLQWKIWDWGKTSRDRQVLTVQQEILQSKKESFDRNLQIMLKDEYSKILKYEESVKRAEEIVMLREKITRNAASQLENGVITSADYITELNAEIQAKLKLETDKIQLIQARINYLTKKGNI